MSRESELSVGESAKGAPPPAGPNPFYDVKEPCDSAGLVDDSLYAELGIEREPSHKANERGTDEGRICGHSC